MTLEFILRVVLAAFLGGIIGLEREYRAKEAGFRTHFLVGLGAAVFMVLSKYGYDDVVAEELVRLDSHISQLRAFLSGDGKEAIGKKIDFLIQEMNREANTIGSKSNDKEITAMMLDFKAEIEKVREQVQNIE